jgi:cytochrome c
MSEQRLHSICLTLLLAAAPAAGTAAPELGTHLRPALGTPAPADYRSSASPDGTGMPSGSARVRDGEAVYAAQCAACHGPEGALQGNALVGGQGSLTGPRPVKTVGSFWPYATTLFDYVDRAMPYGNAGSLTADEVYAVTGWVLHLNGLMDPDDVVDAEALVELHMPNRDGFLPLWPRGGMVSDD